jgi:hypothetical protein
VRETSGSAGEGIHAAELNVVSASRKIAVAPTTHEMTAAGPAVESAPCAPKSQPDPMIEPPDAHNRPMNPISRRSPVARVGPAAGAVRAVTVVVAISSSFV